MWGGGCVGRWGSVVLVRWSECGGGGKVVGHEAGEHELETRETVNLVTNGETRGA